MSSGDSRAAVADSPTSLASDTERRRFFRRHEDLCTLETVEQLCLEASRQLWVDVEKAGHLAATARWLARELAAEADAGLWLARSTRIAANVQHRAGDSKAAQELYGEALERFLALGEEKEAAITRSSALLNLAYLGDYDTVFQWEQAAREVFERVSDRLRLAILEHNFANILTRQDRWREALAHYQAAYEEFLQLERPQDVAVCLRNVAVCHINLFHFGEALAVHQENRAWCQQQGLTRLLLEVDYNIAYLHYLRGEYTRAIQLFRDTRGRCETEGDDYHKALCDLDLGELYLELNLVEDARSLARAAGAGFERLELTYERAKALTNEAIAAGRQGEDEAALELLRQARELFQRENNRLWLGLLDFYQAVVHHRRREPAAALELAEGARRIFEDSGVTSRAVTCELLLAELHLADGRAAEARRIGRRALERLADLELPALEHQAHRVLGRVEEALDDPEAALAAYRQARSRLEQLRSQLRGEGLKIAFLEDKNSVYESLVWLTLRGTPSKEITREAREAAFDDVEQAKSRALADLLALRAHELPPRTPRQQEAAEQVRRLREELNWFYGQIDRTQMRAGERSQEEVFRLRATARQREDELLRSLRELQGADRELSSLQAGFRVDLASLRASLPAEATLVEYFIARGEIFACLLDRDRLEVRPLAPAGKARELHRLLQLQLSKLALRPGQSPALLELLEQATKSHLRDLYDLLLAPLRPELDRPHLIFAPHSFLHYLPFHALLDGERYLVDDYSISYTPSGSVFHLCALKENHWQESSLVLGVADERAPQILAEARAVAGCLPDARLLLGDEATGDALARYGTGTRYVHIASHGLFRRDNPLFSAIQLGGSRLSLFDLYGLTMSAELVVLSGCGTGLAAVQGADELIGLTRGFLYAGAQSVLVTLWDVNDASTATFMTAFYRHLTEGRPAAAALRETMLELRESHPNPYHWAPFLLVGRPGGGATA